MASKVGQKKPMARKDDLDFSRSWTLLNSLLGVKAYEPAAASRVAKRPDKIRDKSDFFAKMSQHPSKRV